MDNIGGKAALAGQHGEAVHGGASSLAKWQKAGGRKKAIYEAEGKNDQSNKVF